MLKKLLVDANIQINLTSIKIVEKMALGLRKQFQNNAKILLSLLMQKFKQRNVLVVDQTSKCLFTFIHCLNIDDVLDDFKELIEDKSPLTKVNVLNFIEIFIIAKANTK